jgi:dihydrofolate reductase
VAASVNQLGGLPWPHLKEDLKFFRITTTGMEPATSGLRNAVIKGRKTWFSLREERRPLVTRKNIVITCNGASMYGFYTVVFFCGGAHMSSVGGVWFVRMRHSCSKGPDTVTASSLADALDIAGNDKLIKDTFVIGGGYRSGVPSVSETDFPHTGPSFNWIDSGVPEGSDACVRFFVGGLVVGSGPRLLNLRTSTSALQLPTLPFPSLQSNLRASEHNVTEN